MLPAWLGIGQALQTLIEEGKLADLREMYERWPFFQSTVDLIEMVLAKADGSIAKDIMPDFLHLTPKGYAIWAEAIEPTLARLMGE